MNEHGDDLAVAGDLHPLSRLNEVDLGGERPAGVAHTDGRHGQIVR
jgi:hypothetical protein